MKTWLLASEKTRATKWYVIEAKVKCRGDIQKRKVLGCLGAEGGNMTQNRWHPLSTSQ